MLKNRRLVLPILLGIIFLVLFAFYNWYYQVIPQAGISLLKEIPAAKSRDTVLVLSPHPDDETIAVGGYVRTAILKGADVWIILVTDGNKHHLKNVRYSEFNAATSTLGVAANHLIYLNYPDGRLARQDQNKLIADFTKSLAIIRPDIVFIPHPKDTHPDHRATSVAVEKAITQTLLKPVIYYYLVHYPHFPLPKRLNQSLYLLPPIRLIEFNREWKSFTLTPEVEDAKLEATLKYKTQLRFPPLKELLDSLVRKNELFSVNK